MFLNKDYSMVMGKRKAVKDEEMELPKEYDRDFEYFSDKRDELCIKHRKPVCGRKEPESLQRQRPPKTVGNLK